MNLVQREFQELISNNPNRDWSWGDLSRNSMITMDFITKTPNFPWDWSQIPFNMNMTREFLSQNENKLRCFDSMVTIAVTQLIKQSIPDKPWDWHIASQISSEFSEFRYRYPLLFSNCKFLVKQNSDMDISNQPIPETYKNRFRLTHIICQNKYILSKGYRGFIAISKKHNNLHINTKNISIINVETLKQTFYEKVDWKMVSQNPGITINFISETPYLPWEYKYVSKNPNLTLEYVWDNLDKDWDWYEVKRTLKINLCILDVNASTILVCFLEIPSNNLKHIISSDPHYFDCNKTQVTVDYIKEYPDKLWAYNDLSKNPNLSLDFVIQNPNKLWNWNFISKNSAVSMEDISSIAVIRKSRTNFLTLLFGDIFYEPWNWNSVSANTNLTIDYVQRRSDKPWNWKAISANPGISPKSIIIVYPEIISMNQFSSYIKHVIESRSL